MSKQVTLDAIAEQAMIARGFFPDFPQEALEESLAIQAPAQPTKLHRDMRASLWVSIDNVDSKDLDQLTYAEGNTIFVAIADVDALIAKDSAIDKRAAHNTTSVYTPTRVFPMLPLKFSNDLTSLNEHTDRCAIVAEMQIAEDGSIASYAIYPALVHNQAKLNYTDIGALLETNQGTLPELPGLREQLFLQHQFAEKIKNHRASLGALEFGDLEVRAVIVDSVAVDIKPVEKNKAHQLIENFMISANTSMARFLKEHKMPDIQRVVKTPKNWDQIVRIAEELGHELPQAPDPKALRAFLLEQQKQHPLQFADLSLAIIKLLGRGEYVFHPPDRPPIGHFDLAEREYTHATAPNRRFPDVIMQRLVKSVLFHTPMPYTMKEMIALASQCTQKEDDASKVERQLLKCAAAFVMQREVGNTFRAMIIGSSPKGTWVRTSKPIITGKLVKGFEGLHVGQFVEATLSHVDVLSGHIDFVRKGY